MSKNKFVVKTLVISMAAAMAAPVIAETKQLPLIDVVGQGQDAVAKQPGSVVIVTKEDIESLQPLSTEDVLRTVPGINIKKEEESGVVANIGMRGLDASSYKTLILEDGVPVAPGLFVGNQRYYNPRIQRMEGIEVLKGASSLRYGPSTIGGVINYKTKTPEDGVSVTGRVGSWGYKEGTIEAGGSNPSGDAFAGIVYTKVESDGFMDKGFKMNDLMVKAGMAIGEDQMVGVKFTHYDNEANISYRGLFKDAYDAGAKYNPAPDDYFLTERNSFDINHEWDINSNMKLKTLAYWSQMSRDYWRFRLGNQDSFGSTPSVSDGNGGTKWNYNDTISGNNRAFERKGVESRLNVTHNLFGVHNSTEVGVRVMAEEMRDQAVTGTRANPRSGSLGGDRLDTAKSYALFAENRFDLNDRLSITAGLRVESYEQERDDLKDNTKDRKTSNTEYSPGIGATYQLNPVVQLYGSIYSAFSPPLNSQSLVSDEVLDLEAEKSINIELGVRGNTGKFGYEVTVFQMDFSNQITPGIQNSTNANAGKTLHQGLEAALGYNFGQGLTLDANVTYIPTSEYVGDRYTWSGTPSTRTLSSKDGNRLPYSPELVANAALGYKTGGLRTALAWNYVGEQYSHGSNDKAFSADGSKGLMPSYSTFDLTANYSVNKQLNVFGAVKNLTDERYIGGLRQGIYVGPERSFELGAKYKF